MIGEYLLRLFLLVPLIGGLAWGSLWLWRRVQLGLPVKPAADRPVRIVDVVTLGPNGKLAVIEFRGREILVAISRSGITAIAQNESALDV
ncbi:flagellar biosynthetic protein FliO [Nostoc sp. HG1]|nr:flagellar biosynthetic protein FliO [Nostoc sp. HG1]